MIRSCLFLLLLVSLLSPASAQEGVPADHAAKMKAGLALFQKSIGPALKEACVRCHGGEKTRSEFDLTSREALLKGGESGIVVDLAKPETSFLLAVIRHEEEPEMPPKGDRLEDSLIAEIEQWIRMGAPYDEPLVENAKSASTAMVVTDTDREFWSFQPVAKVEPPKSEGDWSKNAIDEFVLAALKKEGLVANAPAAAATFVRRAYLDVIGLPPEPEQVTTFLKAHAADPQAAKRVLIDELLASPHYGERWARHWLDAARFAESHGFEQDYDRKFAYHYRDFVIKALNSDMPYDQFVKWQLAGDEMAPEDPLAMMATGFLGAGVFPTQLTEKEFESARYDELDDMASTTGTAMLGLTIGCARCHDHKFDPIPVKDYYQLVSTFTTTIRSEIDVPLDPEGDRRALAVWETNHAAARKALTDYQEKPQVLAAFEKWLITDARAMKPEQQAPWVTLDLDSVESSGGSTLTRQADGSVLVSGKSPAKETHTFRAAVPAKGVKYFRIEALTDESLTKKGPGRAGNGNFALSDLKLFAVPAKNSKAKRRELKVISARATHQQNTGSLSVASAIDGDPTGTGWAVDKGGIGKDQAAVFELEKAIDLDGETQLEFQLSYQNNGQHAIGRPRLSISSQPDPPVVVGGGQSAKVTAAFAALDSGKPGKAHREILFPIFAATDKSWKKLDAAVRQSLANKPQPSVARVQVTSEGFPPTKHHADGRGFPHFYPQTHFLSRGDPNQKQGIAEQGFLQVLMRNGQGTADWQVAAPEDARSSFRRSSLANWMTDTENGAGHLLARVIVNRVWHHHFGRGIVATPNDFGLQGSEPSHPELLDYLAQDLIDKGWRLKTLHRRILLSASYGQSSAGSVEKSKIDPDNQWLWRFAPRRLEAEVIRDSMLAVSGQLDRTMFGPGTLSEDHRRRSVYFMIKRSRLIPIMQIFDQPEPLVSQGSRPSTTIAPQALLFMNNPQVVKWAGKLGERVNEFSGDREAIRYLYQSTLGRDPSADEEAENLSFLQEQIASYPPPNARRQALADLCQVMFGLNEFVYLQ